MYKYFLVSLFIAIIPMYAHAEMAEQNRGSSGNRVNAELRAEEDTTLNTNRERIRDVENHLGDEDVTPEQKRVNKNIDARQVVTNVGKRVQELARDPERMGGIGEQVKVIAQEQIKTQEKIQEHLGKLEERGNMLKFFFGQNKETLDELQSYKNENEQRIQGLKALRDQVVDATEQGTLDTTITDLTAQNEIIQQKVGTEQGAGIVGWFRKLFARTKQAI